jgi:quercetin dioxygenase-like cupin family protein
MEDTQVPTPIVVSQLAKRGPLILERGAGRSYPMGRISATFKADRAETGHTYSVSEWWLEPDTQGPPAHAHPEDHAYYILEGTMSVFVDGDWFHLSQGGFVLIPGGAAHTFENRHPTERAGLLTFNNRAGFEESMPGISRWFLDHPPGPTTAARVPETRRRPDR